ncbi:MAG: lactonase family protein [Anaerolineae bacterium]|nr:lactonase family protein [Anaerolineae bacterium]
MTNRPSTTPMNAPAVFVYVGTYTFKGSEGIYVYRFDPVTGKLDPAGVAAADNPSFLAIRPDKGTLYAVNEVGEFGGEPTGAVSAFAIDPETGMLTFLNQQPSLGRAPAHVSVGRAGQFVYVANYTSGTAAVFPINTDGTLAPASDSVQHVGSGPDPRRQQGPHAHSINLDPGNARAYVADLGLDKVMIYDVASEPGKLLPNDPPFAEVAGGSGPRHFAFHPSGRFAYLINEMGNTITAFGYDPESGALQTLQTVPTLPADFEGRNTTADVHVHPTGHFLYGSNRGHDSIVVYAVDSESGKLSYVDAVSTQGATPRNFALDPTGTYLLAANQDSDNVVVFRVDPESGTLMATGQQVEVSMPVCVKFLVH